MVRMQCLSPAPITDVTLEVTDSGAVLCGNRPLGDATLPGEPATRVVATMTLMAAFTSSSQILMQ